jgi:glucose dehydrogenase
MIFRGWSNRTHLIRCVTLTLAAMLIAHHCAAQNTDWPVYNGSANGEHYSPLTQINRSNVSKLQVAWTFDTGEKGGIQDNPLIVGRVLYAYTPTQKIVALDAATGKPIWKFDSGIVGEQPARGMAYWTDGKEHRLLAGVMNYLYCLDADTGKPISTFGEDGRIDLRKGLREPYEEQSIALTSPGIVYKDLIIVGGRDPETHPAPPGDIRAYNVRTGALVWTFHTIPRPGEPGYETWPKDSWKLAGAANNWAGMSLDAERGIVYAPTGSAVFDFYGGDRVGDDLYANCILALDAATGKLLWHFQGVHHDIWDRDFPSPPALLTLHRNGQTIPALAQTTKQGYIYLFNRVTGEPLNPIHEHPYPASAVPGEVTSPTQPLPDTPAPFARQRLTADDLTNRSPEIHAWAEKEFSHLRSNGQFYPFALDKLTIVFPGYDGGAEWGGPAIDPNTDVLYVNANEMAWLGGLIPATQTGNRGELVYQSQCAVCHGEDRSGAPPAFPSLVGILDRLTVQQVTDTIHGGKGRMPSFPNVGADDLTALLEYLRGPAPQGEKSSAAKELSTVPAQSTAEQAPSDKAGAKLYLNRCAMCHGARMQGNPPAVPILAGVGNRLTAAQITYRIHQGKGAMPPMPDIQGADLDALLRYLGAGEHGDSNPAEAANPPDRYIFTGYRKFLDPDGYPAIAPPWGTLSAIDLKTNQYLWKIRLGEYPELVKQGITNAGTETYGGPIVTAGGVLFIGSTVADRKFHAFDTRNGKLLWETVLPFAGVATPATYMIDGRQYVVIAASGGRDPRSPVGGEYVAFALPRK